LNLITYGFYSGKRYVTESVEFKVNLLQKELFNFKLSTQTKKINLIEKNYIEFKKESKNIKFEIKDNEIIKFDTKQ